MSSVQEEIVALVNAAVEVAVLDELRAVRVELDDQRGLVTAQARVIGELLAWREGQGGAAPAPVPVPEPAPVPVPAPPPAGTGDVIGKAVRWDDADWMLFNGQVVRNGKIVPETAKTANADLLAVVGNRLYHRGGGLWWGWTGTADWEQVPVTAISADGAV